jgi:GT2 family glycosyltransferase/glycosyltransferase involved in cell wall biosynthesis
MEALDSTIRNGSLQEREKWSAYYSELPILEEDKYTAQFNKEFSDCISELLPDGGTTLEAGCGGGWQSLALKQRGGFETALLDFSAEALLYAKKIFDQRRLCARFIEGDLTELGIPEFDLVFNAGVLEHYSFEDQVKLVRGMVSRTRHYVMVLVPNRQCFWYWIWRQLRSTRGGWPWGKEVPVASLAPVFEAAGIQLIGERYFGAEWTESFISECTEKEIGLREQAVLLHRSHIIPVSGKAYLVAALGTVRGDERIAKSWHREGSPIAENNSISLLTSALSDALALHRAQGPKDQPGADVIVVERNLWAQERRALVATIDAITCQTADLQAEKRAFAERIKALEQTVIQLGSDSALQRTNAEVSRSLLEERASRTVEDRAELVRINAHNLTLEQDLSRVTAEYTVARRLLHEMETRVAEDRSRFESVMARMHKQHGEFAAQLEHFRTLKYAAELATSSSATQNLQGQLAAVENDRNALKAEIGRVVARNTAVEQQISEATLQLSEVKAACDLKDSFTKQASVNAYRLEEEVQGIRQAALTALTRFDLALTDLLSTVRSQRAWRVMLFIRKAYTLWMRRGWLGKLSALRLPLELLPGREALLDPYDIGFPNVWDFLPESISKRGSDPRSAPTIETPAVARYDVIVLPLFDFEFRFQRPQQIASGLARSGHRVFWVSPSRFLQDQQGLAIETIPLRDNVFEVRLPGHRLNIYTDELPAQRSAQLAESLTDLYRMNNIGEALVLIQFPFWRQVGLALKSQFGGIIAYDCMDDWRNWTADPRISSFALGEERQLALEADIVLATSAELQQRLEAEVGRQALRLRNAADFEFFRTTPVTDLFAGLQRPIIGYYGALANWVDIGLLADVARQRPNYSLVVIGEVHDTDVTPLRRLQNVHLLGEKPYRMLPAYLSGFDVCVLPFLLNRLTQAVDPVKIYEYLSQGKPVVATPLPEVRDHRDVLYLANNQDEFVAQIDRALKEDSGVRHAARIEYAAANSWSDRIERLHEAVREAFPLVSILVVSHQSREYLKPFLASLRRNTAYPNYEVIVVDNASNDGSAEFLDEYSAGFSQMHVIRLETNRGFAAGNNLAAKTARGEFLVFLNADTIVTWNWLDRLMRPFRIGLDIGMTAPVTNFSGNETRIECRYRNVTELEEFAKERSSSEFGNVLELAMVPLLCAAVSRKAWNEVGELDEQFGLGMFEDDDWSHRMTQCGYRLVAVEDCFVHHFGNGSFTKLPHDQAVAIFERNRAYFESKWGVKWTPHKMRPGVRPVTDVDRVSPDRFMQRSDGKTRRSCTAILLRLRPDHVEIGGSVNKQPEGASALVVECEGASPGTAIKFGQLILQTAYGNATLLSAILPPEFSQSAGSVRVTLVNDFGESNGLTFMVGA